MVKENTTLDIERNMGNFAYPETHTHDAGTGLSEKTIHYISDVKQDPDWVREFRLNALRTFLNNQCRRTGRARIWRRLCSTRSAIT
jgi:hypothetical protein